MSEIEINSQDILNAIDLNKINQNEKKRRGRPKKTQMLVSNQKIKNHYFHNMITICVGLCKYIHACMSTTFQENKKKVTKTLTSSSWFFFFRHIF
jgi:hypothetical protein